MTKIIGIVLCTLLCSLLLKNYSKIFATILSISGIFILIILVIDDVGSLIDKLNEISTSIDSNFEYFKLMIKILGITIVSSITGDLCRENGEIALASVVTLVTKVSVVILIFPLFDAVINIVLGLVK